MESRKEEVPDSKRRSQVNEYGTSASDLFICGHVWQSELGDRTADQERQTKKGAREWTAVGM